MYFQRIFLLSILCALLTNSGFSLYQFYFINPIIKAAEAYEASEPFAINSLTDAEEWMPKNGFERSFYTLLSNFLISLSFCLLLASTLTYQGSNSALKGLVWGLAGYLTFFIAPNMELPPDIPGLPTVDLDLRQKWWLFTVIMTASGLVILAFASLYYKATGFILIALPHLAGVPETTGSSFSHPDPTVVSALSDLWQQFIIHTSIANTLLWSILGSLLGFLCHRYVDNFPYAPDLTHKGFYLNTENLEMAQNKLVITSKNLQLLATTLLGIVILFGVGFASIDITHNAAHDTRHSFTFPCH